jgi:hypothetical protein
MTLFIPWGAFLIAVGSILREIGAFHIQDLSMLISSVVFLLMGPWVSSVVESMQRKKLLIELCRPVYAGTNYFILGRTLYYIPWLSPIHPAGWSQYSSASTFLLKLCL